MPTDVKTIAVIGAGQMGGGIAQVAATAGINAIAYDAFPASLDKCKALHTKLMARAVEKGKMSQSDANAALARISYTADFDAITKADWVVEAAVEDAALKAELFQKLARTFTNPRVVLATNTSSISITRIAAATQRPGQVIGMHFMNPVPVMKLVEVIRGYDTTDAVTRTVVDLSNAIGKVPVTVNDYAGFVANRILMPMINEAIETLFQGVGGVSEIDTVMKLGMAHPMGPLQLADFIGLDTCLAILRVLHQGLGSPKYAPCPLLVQMVTAGKLGVKSGEGFYAYTPGTKDLVVAPAFR